MAVKGCEKLKIKIKMNPKKTMYDSLGKSKEIEDFFKMYRCQDKECKKYALPFGHTHIPIPDYEFSNYNCPVCGGNKKFDFSIRDISFLGKNILYGYHYICENNNEHRWVEKIDYET